MIEVSKQAWHYRLYTKAWEAEPKNLCLYFWGTVTAPLLLFAMAIGGFFAGLSYQTRRRMVVAGFVLLSAWMIGVLAWAIYQNPWTALLIPAVILGLLALVVIVVGIGLAVESHRGEESQGASSSRLTWEFAKAKKQKICPLIKVVD